MKLRSGLYLLAALSLCGLLSGCVSVKRPVDTGDFSPLEIRALQTRTYDEQDVLATLKTVLNVLQDEGYVVEFGNPELGLLNASKTIAGGINTFTYATWTITATVHVSSFGEQTKVRISLYEKIESYFGERSAKPIVDPKEYQQLFAKLDRSIFIHKQGL
ncbi:MAG: hypothetical protein ACK4UN_17835 [Limisphaerales bacterium]